MKRKRKRKGKKEGGSEEKKERRKKEGREKVNLGKESIHSSLVLKFIAKVMLIKRVWQNDGKMDQQN